MRAFSASEVVCASEDGYPRSVLYLNERARARARRSPRSAALGSPALALPSSRRGGAVEPRLHCRPPRPRPPCGPPPASRGPGPRHRLAGSRGTRSAFARRQGRSRPGWPGRGRGGRRPLPTPTRTQRPRPWARPSRARPAPRPGDPPPPTRPGQRCPGASAMVAA